MVLKKSRRVPRKVQDISNIIVNRIEGLRADKTYYPREEDGSCVKINNLDNVDLMKDNWLILTRTRSSLQIAKELKQRGIFFESKFFKSLNIKLHKAGYYSWTEGQQLNQNEIDDSDYMSDNNWNELVPWFEAFDKANLEDKIILDYYYQTKKNYQNHRVKISKGGESDNVLLVLDNARKIRESVLKNVRKRDEEHRVWYVGVTRSRKNLYLMRAKIERYGYNL